MIAVHEVHGYYRSMISWAAIITEYIPSYVQYMCIVELEASATIWE